MAPGGHSCVAHVLPVAAAPLLLLLACLCHLAAGREALPFFLSTPPAPPPVRERAPPDMEAESLRLALRVLGTADPAAASARQSGQVPPSAVAPLISIPTRTYPVCNGPNRAYDAAVVARRDTLLANCATAQPALERQCRLTHFLCCIESVTAAEVVTQMECDLESGLCDVFDPAAGRILIGAWKASDCALEGNQGIMKSTCQCLKAPATAADWVFPAPCVLLLPSTGLLDPATNRSTVETATSGPYWVEDLTRNRTRAVNEPGDDPAHCVPVQPTSVRLCDASGWNRAASVIQRCLEALERGDMVDGSPGECCTTFFTGTNSWMTCIVGGDCVRLDPDVLPEGVLLNDAAVVPGCQTSSGTIQPPGLERRSQCTCAPGLAPTTGCAALSDVPTSGGGCVDVDSDAGGFWGGLSPDNEAKVPVVAGLDVCSAP